MCTLHRIYTHHTSSTLPIFWFRLGLWTMADYLVQIMVPIIIAYMTLDDISLVFNIILAVHRDKLYNRTNEMHIFILFLINSCTCFE